MEKIKNFLKDKGVGYYLVAAVAFVALVLMIIFFSTYNLPDEFGGTLMGNSAAGVAPVTIGIFLLAGILVELAVLACPQFRFIQIVAIVMFSLAFYKDVLIIPDFFAGIANGVEYNHGSTPLNMFFFVTLLVILILAIAAGFIGFYKDDKVANDAMKLDLKNKPELIKTSVSAGVVVAAVLACSLAAAGASKEGKVETKKGDDEKEEEKPDPIKEQFKQIAEEFEYDFDPTSVIIKENNVDYYTTENGWNFNDPALNGLSVGFTREGHNLVYYFEGAYTEGWQGDYTPKYAQLYLWDDGVYVGKSNDTNIKGFWYNSSLTSGTDPETGEDIADTLVMVSNINRFTSIITDAHSGFYSRQGYIFMEPYGGGQRSVIISGYYYYPDVALFIDNGTSPLKYHVGDKFNRGSWTAKRVLKNLNYTAVFKKEEVKWTEPSGMLDSEGKFAAPGEYEITATWNGLTASITVVVE